MIKTWYRYDFYVPADDFSLDNYHLVPKYFITTDSDSVSVSQVLRLLYDDVHFLEQTVIFSADEKVVKYV